MRVIFALTGTNFSQHFLLAWTNLLKALIEAKIDFLIAQGVSSHVAFARLKSWGYNVMNGESQKPYGNGAIPYDRIMCIDSDIVFTPEQFFAMLDAPHDVVTGAYLMSDRTNFACVETWDIDYFSKNGTFKFLGPKDVEEWRQANTGQNYMKISYNGLGWCMMKQGVLERLSYPPVYRPLERIPTGKTGPDDVKELVDMTSEDVGLMKNMQDAGIDVYLDTRIKVGHEKSFVI